MLNENYNKWLNSSYGIYIYTHIHWSIQGKIFNKPTQLPSDLESDT